MRSRNIAALLAVGMAACCAPTAHADVKAVGIIKINSPQINAALQSLSPEQRKKMAAMGLSDKLSFTLYISGNHIRTDIGPTSIYTDLAAHKQVIVNRTNKTMSSSPLDTASSGDASAHIIPTGKTAKILGHTAHQYKFDAASAATGTKTSGEIWAASDIPGPQANPFGAQLGALYSAEISKIKGLPLKTTIKSTGGYAGETTITGTVTSVSKNPLPARVFTVPSGYHQGSVMPMGMPG